MAVPDYTASLGAMMFNLMNRREFEDLWELEKSIVEEVRFSQSRQYPDVYAFDRVEVLTNFSGQIFASGTYECKTRSFVYQFRIEGVGPIVRYCIGGTKHGSGGRYHQHGLRRPECCRNNLPIVSPRDDLRGLTARAVWHEVLKEGNITHADTFYEPEALCI